MDISGRNNLQIIDALATAIVALDKLPEEKKPHSNLEGMRLLLSELSGGAVISAMLAQAECRLNPDADPLEIFARYGIERR